MGQENRDQDADKLDHRSLRVSPSPTHGNLMQLPHEHGSRPRTRDNCHITNCVLWGIDLSLGFTIDVKC